LFAALAYNVFRSGAQWALRRTEGPTALGVGSVLVGSDLGQRVGREFGDLEAVLLLDHVPVLSPEMRNEARRFTLLIDTLYDEGVKLICSAAAAPDALYPQGDGADAFRRTASRLAEMQSEDYLKRGHGIHGLVQ